MNPETKSKYHRACNLLAIEFVEKIFGKEYLEGFNWVGKEVGGTVAVSDCFINILEMYHVLDQNYTSDEFHDWYEQWLENDPHINAKNFKKLTKSNESN